jgi:hypothetical protein
LNRAEYEPLTAVSKDRANINDAAEDSEFSSGDRPRMEVQDSRPAA